MAAAVAVDSKGGLSKFIQIAGREETASLLNLGAGVKVLVSESAALRAEYRFQRYRYEDTFNGASYDVTDSFQNILFGLSLFFPPQPTRMPMSIDAGHD